MVNSGMTNIGIFADGKTRSLMDHLGSGKPWDLARKNNGIFVFSLGSTNYYMDEIETLKNNIEYFYKSKEKYVIYSPSYMVCNIDYKAAATYHESTGADITIIYKKIIDGKTNFVNCDVLNLGTNDSVLSVGKNIGMEDFNNISTEMFIMKKEILISLILECVRTGYYRNIKEAIYRKTDCLKINAYEFKGYLSCINSVGTYYKTNMDLLDLKTNRELFFENGPIFTKGRDESPTRYDLDSKVSNSLVANGCIIEGEVENSLIFRRVKIHKGAVVKNCIIMQNCEIKPNAKLTNIIIDKNVIIEDGKELKGDWDLPLVVEKKLSFE
jgi:glucose-1-phosphate adenylyltransferase